MKTTPLLRLTYNTLLYLFNRSHKNELNLKPEIGIGSVQIFKVEKGLQVMVWDCLFFSDIEVQNHSLHGNECNDYHLAYFVEPQGLEAISATQSFQKVTIWNTCFVTAAADYKISVVPMINYRCVSIHFSAQWLHDVLLSNCSLKVLKENIGVLKNIALFQNMKQDERTVLENILNSSRQQQLRLLNIKAVALKLTCDFLYTLKTEQPFHGRTGMHGIIDEVELYLCAHVTKKFAGTKALAEQFSISESTLKRQFKKKFGVTISAYLTKKKMQFAREQMQQKGISVTEASRMVAYQSAQSFKELYEKHYNNIRLN